MKRAAIAIIGVAVIVGGCNDKKSHSGLHEIKPNPVDVAKIEEILEHALHGQEGMRLAKTKTQTDAEKEAYAIFVDFWNPRDLGRYCGTWNIENYSRAKYLLIQHSLVVETRVTGSWDQRQNPRHADPADPERKDWKIQNIDDFVPQVNFHDARILYLTQSLTKQLEDFLGGDISEEGTSKIMSAGLATGRSQERLTAALTQIQVFPKHWDDGWHLVSHPLVSRILFSPDYSEAIVEFRIGYKGGYALYNKRAEHWSMKESHQTWIE
jgi:hypothetical protein